MMGQMVKNPPAGAEMQETEFDPWVEKIPQEQDMTTNSSILAGENPLGQRAWWAGYGPWVTKLDMTEVTKHTYAPF